MDPVKPGFPPTPLVILLMTVLGWYFCCCFLLLVVLIAHLCPFVYLFYDWCFSWSNWIYRGYFLQFSLTRSYAVCSHYRGDSNENTQLTVIVI